MRRHSGVCRGRLLAPALVLLALLCAFGCRGSSSATVSGKISNGGETLGGGRVDFVTPDGKWADSSPIGEDGSYTIKNAPLGTVKITVETESVRARAPRSVPGMMEPPKDTPARPHVPKGGKYVKIPDLYADIEKTPLTYEITKGSQTHDIDLK